MIIYIVKVYEEEVLGSTVPLWWSSNGTKIAFASFDDTAVKPITLTRYIENSLAILEKLWYIPSEKLYMSQLLLFWKFEYTGGPIFKVVLEC